MASALRSGLLLFGVSAAIGSAAIASTTYGPRTDYRLPGVPGALDVADFNQDGKLDVLCSQSQIDSVTLFLNDGNGGLVQSLVLWPGLRPKDVEAADLNGDLRPDAVIPYYDGVAILWGTSEGGFRLSRVTPIPARPAQVAIGDFNGDMQQDLVVGTGFYGYVFVFLNNGDETFTQSASVFTAGVVSDLYVGDFNEDGNLDIIESDPEGGPSLLLGDGQGGFTRTVLDLGPSGSVVGGDFDGDGHLDLANGGGTYDWYSRVTLWHGYGNGTFSRVRETPVYCCPANLDVVDLDDDGDLDLVAVASPWVSVMLNDGTGFFVEDCVLPQPEQSSDVRAADLDGDGVREIITTIAFGDSLTVYKGNAPTTAAPTFGSVGLRIQTAPNPARGQARLVVTGLDRDATVSLFDLSGRVVEKRLLHPGDAARGLQIPRDGKLAAGVYVVRIEAGRVLKAGKIVIVP